MALTDYSTTPANNSAAPPDGAPEGMAAAAVNNTMRQIMADIKGGVTFTVANKAAMSALDAAKSSEGDFVLNGARITTGDSGGGLFRITKTDISTDVTGDPQEGIFVAFDSDASGASGGFIREIIGGTITPVMFGALTGSTTTDSLTATEECLKFCAANDVICDWTGDFRINAALILDSDYNNLTTIGVMNLRPVGTFSSDFAAFLIPGVGDPFGGAVAGANDMNLDVITTDGTNAAVSTGIIFTVGVAVEGGLRNKIQRAEGRFFKKTGVRYGSSVGNLTDIEIEQIIVSDNDSDDGTVGQGWALEARNEDDIFKVGSLIAHDNGIFGFDFSDGNCEIASIEAFGNGDVTHGGGGGKWSGLGVQKTYIGSLRLYNNIGTGATTTGDQGYIRIDNAEIFDDQGTQTQTQGLQISHEGIWSIAHLYIANNINNGLQVQAGDVHIGTLEGDANGANLCACTGGSIHVDYIDSKNHATGGAFVISNTGAATFGNAKSSEDRDGCIRFVGSSTQYSGGDIEIAHATLTAPGLFTNGNPTNVRVGKITASGTAVVIDDSATATVREGRKSNLAGITAFATGGQGSATQLTDEINTVGTVGTAGDSVKLLAAEGGLTQTILNNGANALDVFPASGDDIGAGTDTAVSLAAGANITYQAISATTWFART